jgi:tetratricopeptide (TPR) repeat protein
VAVAQLSLVEAGFLERLHGIADRRTVAAWDAVFEAAVRAALLPLARAAAQRLQLLAVDRGDMARVAVLAHRSADLAAQVGDLRAEVLARGEEALALARLPDHRDDALRIAEDAVARAAAGPTALHARARLAQGQVLEQVGEAARARAVFRKILEDARADTSFAREVAFAALHLGRLELSAQPHTGVKTLDFARELGRRGGEWRIYGPAARALLEHHMLGGDRFRVGVLLRELAVEAPRLGGDLGTAVFEEIRAELERRWGAGTVRTLLAAP